MKRGGEKKRAIKNVLFVCRYNRFRSRVAAAYFKKLNKGRFNVKSAGIIRGESVGKIAKKVAGEFGLDISGNTKGLSSKLLLWADKIFVIANDVPLEVFKDNKKSLGKTTILKIRDTNIDNYKNLKTVANSVVAGVDKLNKKLKIDKT